MNTLNFKSSTQQIRDEIGGAKGTVVTNVPASLSTLVSAVVALLTLVGQRVSSALFEGDVELQVAVMGVWLAALALAAWRAGKWAQRFTWPDETVKQDFLIDAETGLPDETA